MAVQKQREGCALARRLGQRLHRWREEHDLPLKALASDLGVSISTVDAWENGTRFPSAAHLETLSEYTHIPLCGLIWQGEGDCGFFNENSACACRSTTTPD